VIATPEQADTARSLIRHPPPRYSKVLLIEHPAARVPETTCAFMHTVAARLLAGEVMVAVPHMGHHRPHSAFSNRQTE
jgi:hypothetical protein